jgi:Family of unknown function (DUF6069)
VDGPTDTPTEPPVEPRRIPVAGLAAIVAAITANFAIYRIARATDAVPDDLPESVSAFGMGSIIFLTILTLAIATAAMWLFTRFSTMPIRNFTTLTVIIFITSLPPLFSLDIATEFRATLMLMHAATAFSAWWCLTRLSQPSSAR